MGLGVVAVVGLVAYGVLYGLFLLVARVFWPRARVSALRVGAVQSVQPPPDAGRMGAMQRALADAKEEEARRADVHIRVNRDRQETGNTASESYRRWLHLKAESWNEHPARDAHVSIRIRTDADRGVWREWYWTDARQVIDIVRGSPVAIPIALGDIAEPPAPSGVAALLYSHDHYAIGRWFLTPKAHTGGLVVIDPGRYWLDVEIKWGADSVTDYFILELPPKGTRREAELIHTVGKERY